MGHSSKRQRTEMKGVACGIDEREEDGSLYSSSNTNSAHKKGKKKYIPDEDLDYLAGDVTSESVKEEYPLVDKEEEEELIAKGKLYIGKRGGYLMALSVIGDGANLHAATKKSRWTLYGHDEEVISGCAYRNLLATCSVDGVAFLWKLNSDDKDPLNVCKLSSGGPAFLDSTFTNVAQLATAQGDGCVGLWDAQIGKKVYTFSRYKTPGRAVWPVINTIEGSIDSSPMLLYGGDDGYLVLCDARSASIVSSLNLRTPITAISIAAGLAFVGDACGHVKWFDFRINEKSLVDLKCSHEVVTGVSSNVVGDRLAVYTMDGKAALIDTKPFALSNEERFLNEVAVFTSSEDRVLRKCDWSDRCESVVFPSPDGIVECLNPNVLSDGSFRSIKSNGALNFAFFVQDKYVLCGGESSVELCEW